MEEKCGSLEKKMTTNMDIKRDIIFQKNGRVHPFIHKKNEEILEELKSITSRRGTQNGYGM
jgi:hypothetical protein